MRRLTFERRRRLRAGPLVADFGLWRLGLTMNAAIVCAVALCALATPVSAAGFGQIEAWGAAGTGAGQFNEPASCALFGADPVDGSVYVGDLSADQQSCRLQKLSPTGKSEGSVAIPRFGPAPLRELLGLRGVAVDHAARRLYVLEGSETVARKILIYSTEPNEAGQLVPPAQAPATLSLPSGGEALRKPTSIAVDPASGEIVILAENAEKHAVVQRIGTDGKAGTRFVDTGNVLRPPNRGAKAIAVGPDGTTYTLTGNPAEAGAEWTRAWEIPPSLSSIGAVPGFSAAAEGEGWKAGLLKESASVAVGGPQIAISPDGKTLYWKENREASNQEEPGEIAVRGYSLEKRATSVVYGGHLYEEGRGVCAIGTGPAPIAATGGRLVVFDHAFPPGGGYGPPRIVTFGPGGSGCNATAEANLAIDGVAGEPVSVQKGVDVVGFDASESELGGQVEKVEWDFGDGEVEEVPGPEAALTTSHRYLQAGTFTATVRIKLAGPEGPTGEASGTVDVGAATPQAFLEVLEPPGFSVPAGGTAVFDASQSWDPTGVPSGEECTQVAGCPGSDEMAAYAWSFGDGSPTQTTTVPTISHEFANPESAPLSRLVTLTVESAEGKTDSDSRLITVQGTPGPAATTPNEALLAPSAIMPEPVPSGGDRPAEKSRRRHAAIARCRRLKAGKRRHRCKRAARALGGKHERRGRKR